MAKKKRKLTKFGRMLSDIVIVVCLFIAGFSGWNLYKELHEYQESKETYEKLTPSVVIEKPSTDESGNAVTAPEFDWEKLKEINGDFVGWIRLDDSTVDYPFVQGTDNEYYLRHLFDGTYNNSGCVFMDVNNNRDFSDKNTILYAHNMKNGTMFASIEKYKDASYYDGHKVIHIYTEAATYDVYPVAGIVTDGQDDYVRTSFSDDNDFMSYVNRFVSSSTFTSEQSIEASDRMIMLSTCNYDRSDGRYVLIGKLVQEDNNAQQA